MSLFLVFCSTLRCSDFSALIERFLCLKTKSGRNDINCIVPDKPDTLFCCYVSPLTAKIRSSFLFWYLQMSYNYQDFFARELTFFLQHQQNIFFKFYGFSLAFARSHAHISMSSDFPHKHHNRENKLYGIFLP